MDRATLDELRSARAEKRSVLLMTELPAGTQRLLSYDAVQALEGELGDAAREAFRRDQALVHEAGESRTFLQPHQPPLRLICVGAVHIAQPLVRLAGVLGFDVIVVDPRAAWTKAARFPTGVQIVDEWPDDAMEELGPDHRTAVVALTHDPKLDDPALAVTLASSAFYVGALGSRKTHATRLKRLKRAGVSNDALGRIAGPIGLPIGARSPAEIAVSILAEVVQTLRKGFTPRELPEAIVTLAPSSES
ncbi:MAG: XdhC family protein [Myxococcota bacterium]